MPYKNPEDKRRWEREHREERNARRRLRHLEARDARASAVMPDPASSEEKSSGCKIFASIVVGVAIALLGAMAGDRSHGVVTEHG